MTILEVALAAVNARKSGRSAVTLGSGQSAQTFDLDAGGYCARFVRQCVEVALGLKPFTWAGCAPDARGMEKNLKKIAQKVPVEKREPGDIVCMNETSGKYGHIGLCVDPGTIAENTSSGKRGSPRPAGTKLTSWTIIASSVSGVYRLKSAAVPTAGVPTHPVAVKVVEQSNGKLIAAVAPSIADLLVGYALAENGDHRRDQGKVYVTRRK